MISIVTAYYNRKKLFVRTLESIKKQNFQEAFEVIAVDDGSDNEERVENLVEQFPFLRVIRLEKKQKWYHNSCIPFNIGFRAAKGDKIIIQNPECLHFGNILEYTATHLKKNTYLSFSCFSLDKTTTENLDSLITNPENIKMVIEKNNHIIKNDGEAGWYNHSVFRPEAFHFCTAILKQDLSKLGGFDELYSYGIGYDDNEFLWRIKKMGMQIQFVDEELILHQNHYSPESSSYQNRADKNQLINKNILLFVEHTKEKKGYSANGLSKYLSLGQKKNPIKYQLQYLKTKRKYFRKFKNLKEFFIFRLSEKFNKTVKKQLANPLEIPIIIINYNQLYYLRQLLDFLRKRNFKNIIIVDNNSTYPPLLDFYEEKKENFTLERMKSNLGHLVFFENKELQQKYNKGFYFLTDADIVPNENLPKDFATQMIGYLRKYFRAVTKVGFALDIENIPEEYPLKEKVFAWEKNYWRNPVEKNVYKAKIDTTFALYKPGYPKKKTDYTFYNALRLSGDFTCKHGGWYLNPNALSEEQKFYLQTSSSAGSWTTKLK